MAALVVIVCAMSMRLASAADAASHEGMVVSAGESKLVMTDADGKEHSHTVAPSIPVTVNGKPGKLEDLKKGTRIRVSTDKDGNVLTVATLDARKRSS